MEPGIKPMIKIMIVEDEVITGILYTKILTRLGYDVCGPLGTGEESIEKAKEEQPEVVLMDINLLGKMDGIEAAKQICECMDTKIIFVTGYSLEDFRERIEAVAPLAFLSKPLSFKKVDSLIRSVFP